MRERPKLGRNGKTAKTGSPDEQSDSQERSPVDADGFDALTHAFATVLPRAVPRRAALGGAVGAGITAVLSGSGGEDAGARRKKKAKKRGCPGGRIGCGASCVNLAISGANCGFCNRACISNGCVNGVCTCGNGPDQCPLPCVCAPRFPDLNAGFVCIDSPSQQTCAGDGDCPLGSACLITGKCSNLCLE